MANPAVLRNLLAQYEALAALHAEDGGGEARQRMQDVSYSLCVAMDTKDVDIALAGARRLLAGPGSVRPGPRPG